MKIEQTINTLFSECTKNNRICPLPRAWSKLHGLFLQSNSKNSPPGPLILGG